MKKGILALLFLSTMQLAYALPVGNPAEPARFGTNCCNQLEPHFLPDWLGVAVGYSGDFVFNRNLETVTGKKIDYSQLFTNAGRVSFTLCDRVNLFTALGVTNICFNTSLGPFNPDNRSPRFDFKTSSSFSWSIGGRALLWQYKCMYVGIGGSYFATKLHPKVLFIRTNVDVRPDESSRRRYSEWQIDAGISLRISCYFIPYAAIKYSSAFWRFNQQTFVLTSTLATIPNVRSRKHVGYAIGLTLAPLLCKMADVSVEGRFADETALHVKAQLHY